MDPDLGTDVAVAGAVLAGQVALVLASGDAVVARLAAAVACALSLLLRRRLPLFPVAVALADGLLIGELPLALAAGAYALLRFHPRPRWWWLAPAAVAVFLLGPRLGDRPGVLPLLLLMLVVPALSGALVRARAGNATAPGLMRGPAP